METTLGWHQDPDNDHLSRYWDGTRWTGELIWDGSAWVVPETQPEATAPEPDPAPRPAVAAGSGFPMTRNAWILAGAAVVAGIGSLLPWERVSAPTGYSVTQSPGSSGGAAIFLLALVAGVVALAWPARTEALSKPRLIGLAVIGGIMSLLVVAKFNVISSDQAQAAASASGSSSNYNVGFGDNSGLAEQYAAATKVSVEAGLGLYLFAVGTIAVWVGVARGFLGRR